MAAALTLPTTAVHASFLAAMAELVAEGRGAADDHSVLGRDLRAHAATWNDPAVFARIVAALIADRLEESPRPEGWVAASTWWWVKGNEYLGRIALRHRLDARLLEQGGHIGYDVRPSARRRGHATAMLAAALSEARALAIDRVLVTCDEENVTSRRVIERCGGVLEDQRGRMLRFWIATG